MLNMALGFWWLAILWTYTELFARPFDDWKNTLLYIGAGIFVAIRLKKKNASAGPLTPALSPWERGFVLLYFLICVASIVVAPTGRYEGALELARLILWVGLAWAFAQCSSRTWLWLMRLTVISAASIAVLTWLQSRGSSLWPYPPPFLPPIGHMSYYGDFMALSLVMAVGMFVLAQNSPSPFAKQSADKQPSPPTKMDWHTGKGVVWIFCMFLIDMGLALSAMRTSLVAIIVGLLLALPLVGQATRSLKKVAIIAIIGIINLAIVFSLPLKSVRDATAKERLVHVTSISRATVDAISSGRWHTYVTSAQIAMERPLLGWGLGTFRFVYPEFAHRHAQDSLTSSSVWYMHPHNEALHQAVELGFPGTLLFFLGFMYLLYGGTRALRCTPQRGASKTSEAPLTNEHQYGDDDSYTVFLITALCGLTVAFVSWQLSTNFLFPVSRLMTALLGGVIVSSIPHPLRERERGICYAMIVLVSLSTLLLATYQLSLVYVNKRLTAASIDGARRYAAWSVDLAPGAFDTLFARAGIALRTEPPEKAAPAIEALYERYPYVPAVLQMMGYLRARQGNIPEARELLIHALANDPASSNVKQLLDQLPPGN